MVLRLFIGIWVIGWAGALAPEAAAQLRDPALVGVWQDTLRLGSPQPFQLRPFMVPESESLFLEGQPLGRAAYRLDYRHGWLWVDAAAPDSAQLVVHYRVLPFVFDEVYQRQRLVAAEGDATQVEQVTPRPRPRPSEDGGVRLQRSGSITRGLLAGNNRDVSIESGLRLQLSGEIAEGVEVEAVLTDENTPILPEGTTQRLDEFDRVYIQLRSRHGQAQLGDFDLQFSGTEFAQFQRKLQGIAVNTAPLRPASDRFFRASGTVAGATARGIFRSQDLTPVDGVQGPYRLQGENGERFILVVPGTEAVYLDGQRLTRGETNDYVIDYALGEITFTPQRLITEDQRLTVEFQYTTNQFSRTLVGGQGVAHLGRTRTGQPRLLFGVTFLREADGDAFNDAVGLTALDSLRLQQAGDAEVFVSGAEPVIFDAEAPYVQYRQQTRPLPGGGLDTVFVALDAQPAPGEQVFRVRFSFVGSGRGDYVRVGRTVNGIQYEYRGPGQGDWAPERPLPRPRLQHLLDLRAETVLLPGLRLTGEWAQSLNDVNRLSNADGFNDRDQAYLLRASWDDLQPFATEDVKLSAGFSRRFSGQYFKTFDRTRPVEFGRKWNLGSRSFSVTGGDATTGDEVVEEGHLGVAFSALSFVRGEVGRIELGEAFRGLRTEGRLHLEEDAWPTVQYQVEWIDSEDAPLAERGHWLRQRGNVSRRWIRDKLRTQVEIEHERRRQRPLGQDSLLAASRAFVEVRPGVRWVSNAENPEASRWQAGLSLEWRTEEQPALGRFRHASEAWTLQSSMRYRAGTEVHSNTTLGYRQLRYTEFFRVQAQREDAASLVLQWSGHLRPWQRAVDLSWLYDGQTERAPTLQEIFVRVGPELGQYVWLDGSGADPEADGIIQLDEFQEEQTPDEGTYYKTFVPSDDLTAVVTVQARLRLSLDPARIWRQPTTPWQRWLANVSTRTTLEVLEKNESDALTRLYLLDQSAYRNAENTLNGRIRWRQEVTLFRNHDRFGVTLTWDELRAVNRLAAGLESRQQRLRAAEAQYRPSLRWTLRGRFGWSGQDATSAAFDTRNYAIDALELSPEVVYSPTRAFQVSGGVAFSRKTDAVRDVRATLWKLPFEAQFAQARRLNVLARFEWASVHLSDRAAGQAGFELTDGRGAGTSARWGLQGQYSLNRYLRATLAYDGRNPENAPVLHTLRMQLSAIF